MKHKENVNGKKYNNVCGVCAVCCVLLEENLGGAFAEHPEAAVSILQHGAHGFSDRVEGVDFVEFLLWDLVAYCLVVLFQVQHEAQQGTFRFVAHLTRQPTFLLRRLRTRKGTEMETERKTERKRGRERKRPIHREEKR